MLDKSFNQSPIRFEDFFLLSTVVPEALTFFSFECKKGANDIIISIRFVHFHILTSSFNNQQPRTKRP
jgi:hypothetical protein